MKGPIPFLIFILMSFVLTPARVFGYANTTVMTRSFLATVTAYTSSAKAVTASGSRTFDGVVACPRRYPFGTRFLIDGKLYECRDRLNRRYDSRFDIWKPSKNAARTFGKRTLKVITVNQTTPLLAEWIQIQPVRY
jgi:3D (Asp-Asp-Asp) domain-containing protein